MSSKPAHFVFVHGGGHGAWCWYKTVDLLRRAGHKATAVDLISCGRDYTDPNHVESFLDYNEPLMELLSNLPDNDKVDSLSLSTHLLLLSSSPPSPPHSLLTVLSSFQGEWVNPISDSDCVMMICTPIAPDFFVQELCSQEICDDNVDQNHKKSKFMSADCS